MRYPSVKTIEARLGEILEHEYGKDKVHEKALEIRRVLVDKNIARDSDDENYYIDIKLEKLNSILHGYGIEALSDEKYWQNGYWCSVYALYINMGDTYIPTIIYGRDTDRFEICSWGDWIEWWENKGAKKHY